MRMVKIVMVSILTAVLRADVSFELSASLTSECFPNLNETGLVEGQTGGNVDFIANVNLSSQNIIGDGGPQGWSLGLTNDGVKIIDARTEGTVADDLRQGGLRDNGFELTEVVNPQRNNNRQGFISAVILSLTQPVTLPPNTTQTIAKATYRATIPNAETLARLAFVNDLSGSGRQVQNSITYRSNAYDPVLRERILNIRKKEAPERKTPVIIIPGIMGTELYDDEANELIWLDPSRTFILKDYYLLRLLLQKDGIFPHRKNRCYSDFSWECNSWLNCPLLNLCALPGPDCCVTGGRRIRVGAITNIEECCFLEGFTAYKDLVRFLERNGYEFNKNLFLFGYDWRVDIGGENQGEKAAINGLHNTIQSLTPNCGDKVNIIAHSMGGLLTRTYLKEYPDDHKIDTVIYMGTPHQGAPKAYSVLRWADKFVPKINRHTLSFISQNFPSVYQLLPRSKFLINKDGKLESIEESFGSLSNQGLVTRANAFHQNIQNFNPIERSFAINGSGQYTLAYFRINNKGDVEVFPNIWGDGTVPSYSSSEFLNTQNFFVNGEHQKLPGIPAAHEKIIKILEGKENEPVEGIQENAFEAAELMRWSSLSPITVSFTDQDGNITGRGEEGDIQEEIPNSQFFVFPQNEAGFLPKNNVYRVDIQALETETFTLLFETLDADGNVTDSLAYQDIPISNEGKGELLLSPDNPSPELTLDVDGNGSNDFQIQSWENPPEELQNMFVENGDVNKDRKVDISDAVSILGYLFLGAEIVCPQAANTNDDKNSDISDAIYLLGYLFLGTAEKPKGLIFCP